MQPRELPQFVLDFDLSASVRYDALFEHFKVPLLEMENYFYHQIPPSTRYFYAVNDNLEKFRKANPDVYGAMERLAEVLGLEVL